MKELQIILNKYVQDQNNGLLNFELAERYSALGSKAAACSYYLRAAELVSDQSIKLTCFQQLAWNYYTQSDRYDESRLFADYGIAIDPLDPYCYCIKCVTYCEQGDWLSLINLTQQCINLPLHQRPVNQYFVDKMVFRFYLGLALLNIGQVEEGLYHLNETILNSQNQYVIKQAVQIIDSRGFTPSHLQYGSDQGSTPIKFLGSEKINTNYSQCLQDLFVLKVTNGLCGGTYLEIGSSDPELHNNTKLLEEFDWIGISLDIDQQKVIEFNSSRRNKSHCLDATKVNYQQLIRYHLPTVSEWVDYLQVDCEPSENSYKALQLCLQSGYKFGIITFEHDYYNNPNLVRSDSRKLLESLGYILVAGNIGMCKLMPYEDWYIHKDYLEVCDEFKSACDPLVEYTDPKSLLY